jgi:type I restriction enzyme S subunit
MSTLGDALVFAGVPERIAKPEQETFVTVKLNSGGAVQRVIGSGKTPVPFTGYRIRAGQFIYSRIDARNGAFAIVPPGLDGAVVSKDFPVFTIRRDRVEPTYLYHYFRAGRLQRLVLASSFGATNRQRITEDRLLAFPIPLPPLAEQRRISAILDQADVICAKRRQVLAHIDALAQSLFHDMFGTRKSLAWGRVSLGELGEWRSGGTPSRAQPEYFGGEVPWFSSGELGQLYISSSVERITSQALAETSAKEVPAGSILVAMYDTAALKSSITTVSASCNQAIAFAQLSPSAADTVFVYFAIQAERERVLALRRGIRQKNLNLAMVREIAVPRAPLELQTEFSRRVGTIMAQRNVSERAVTDTRELFASLQARAFRGEL